MQKFPPFASEPLAPRPDSQGEKIMQKEKKIQKTPAERPQIEAVESKPAVGKHREFIMQKKPKVAIVGCSDTCKQTPFHLKDEFEFWGVNNLYMSLKGPWTRWFEIHHIAYDTVQKQWTRRGSNDFRGMQVDRYLRELQALSIPVYVQGPCELLPNGVLYPLNDVLKMTQCTDYLTNTVSAMIALALLEGHYEEIHIYGVDMAVGTEYFHQRPSCEYFLGIAAGRGIKIHIPDECDLLKTRFLYGFEEPKEIKWNKKVKNMINSMQIRQNTALQKAKFHEKQAEQYIGAISAAQEIKKIWDNL